MCHRIINIQASHANKQEAYLVDITLLLAKDSFVAGKGDNDANNKVSDPATLLGWEDLPFGVDEFL